MKHNSHQFHCGLKDGIPIGLGYLAVSFTFGIMARGAGLTTLQSVVMSFTNLTSAGQFAALGIIQAGAPFKEITGGGKGEGKTETAIGTETEVGAEAEARPNTETESIHSVTLDTERLLLRPFEEKDAEAFFACCQNPNLGNNAGWPPHRTLEASGNSWKSPAVYSIPHLSIRKVYGQ